MCVPIDSALHAAVNIPVVSPQKDPRYQRWLTADAARGYTVVPIVEG